MKIPKRRRTVLKICAFSELTTLSRVANYLVTYDTNNEISIYTYQSMNCDLVDLDVSEIRLCLRNQYWSYSKPANHVYFETRLRVPRQIIYLNMIEILLEDTEVFFLV